MRKQLSKRKTLPTLWVQGSFLLMTMAMGAIPAASAPSNPGALPAPSGSPAPAEAKAAPVDRPVLEEVVEKALERQLAPVKEMLTEMTVRRTSLTDIIGGLGYILGIFGIWAYCLSKRKKAS